MLPLALTKVSPTARVSTTRTSPATAARGPRLVTRMVLTILPPCATGFGVFDLVIDRSTPSATTLTLTDAALLAGTPSAVEDAIVVVLVVLPAASGAVALMTMSLAAPTA